MGTTEELWNVVCEQVDKMLKTWNIQHSLAEDTKGMYKERLGRMMAKFEEVFPDKGLMIVIDEMLEYLKGRASDDRLNRDLSVLRALGEFSNKTKFRMVFGVQEQIYKVPQFQFAAQMLNHANDRYRAITITKQDVQFVVQERLLHKSDEQKNLIRQHLSKFTEFFTNLHANLEDYVNIFPVNPSFFENFQQIRIGKNQREVMKTLTKRFTTMLDEDVPENNPGLICYDHYWDDLNVPAMMTEADVQRVSDIMEIVHQKINDSFTAARAKKAPLAHRIANACAVKILQDTLEHTNGVTAENLIEDLCYLDDTCFDRDMLGDVISSTAQHIVSATVGQYFEKNSQNQEFHLRIEGGVNYEQKIKEFAETMSADNKDSHFFNYLVENLPIEVDQYRREFKIFQHRIDWKSHKTMLDGYIFMGNPTERSTTQPEQYFYIYFMPIFNLAKVKHGDEPDSVYVHLDKVSDEMKELISLYAAAEALIKSVDSSQQKFYEQYKKSYEDKLRPVFQRDFLQCTEIYYQGEKQVINPSTPKPGSSKEQIISEIASTLLEDYFCEHLPAYPKFTLLRNPMTSENRSAMINGAKQKIARPQQPNRDGEAILAGLGLLADNQLNIDGSQYAQSVKMALEAKGEGQVLNRDEILYQYFEHIWRSKDFEIEADLEFLVLCAMVGVGEIEISLPGKNINAANIGEITSLAPDASYMFSHVRRPKDMNISLVREIFIRITGHDLTSQMSNPETYTKLLTEAKALAARAVTLAHKIRNGIFLENEEVVTPFDGAGVASQLTAFSGFCDKLQNYGSEAKMRNITWKQEELTRYFEAIPKIEQYNGILNVVEDLRGRISYLSQARQYMTGNEMRQKVDDALARVRDIASIMSDSRKISDYKTQLDTLAGEYADWYLAEYLRMHISGIEEKDKNSVLRSKERQVCEAVFTADVNNYITAGPQYREWMRKMSQLVVANSNVSRESILRTCYQGFNPAQTEGKSLPKVSDLRTEIMNIHGQVIKSLEEIANDRQLVDRVEAVLSNADKRLLKQFVGAPEDLTPEDAPRMIEVITKLHQDIQKVEFGVSDIRTVFNRPMTAKEIKQAFSKYIDSIAGSYDNDNVRIIFK